MRILADIVMELNVWLETHGISKDSVSLSVDPEHLSTVQLAAGSELEHVVLIRDAGATGFKIAGLKVEMRSSPWTSNPE